MRALLLILSASTLLAALSGARTCAAEKQPPQPSLRVLVDPRVELLSIIFRLAGNREYNQGRVESYTKDVDAHFGPFRKHAVVELADKLRRTRGVSYDACMSMAVHLADAYTVAEKLPLVPRPAALDGRWRDEEIRAFLAAARQFVRESAFQDFVAQHAALYAATESRMTALLEKEGHLDWFDSFFGARPKKSFTVALGLLNGGGCYGPHCRDPQGNEELYCILGVWQTDEQGVPTFTRDMLSTVVHEFAHSYANPIIDRHAQELQAAGEKLFPQVAAALRAQAYSQWRTMFYESLVRASVLRYTWHYDGLSAAWLATQAEKRKGFPWIGKLSDLLGEYEKQRDKYPTLEDFAPRLVDFFDRYARDSAPKEDAQDAQRPKVVSMVPANGATGVDPDLKRLEVVFDRPMADGSWSLVGGGPHFPETAGKPSYDAQRTTWSVPVKLKPDWQYQFQLNSDQYTAFRSQQGVPLAPVSVSFTTRKR